MASNESQMAFTQRNCFMSRYYRCNFLSLSLAYTLKKWGESSLVFLSTTYFNCRHRCKAVDVPSLSSARAVALVVLVVAIALASSAMK